MACRSPRHLNPPAYRSQENLVTTASVAQRPNLVGNPYSHTGDGKQYLNPAAFRAPAPKGTYGNLGFDAIKGPLFNNWDVALQKNIAIRRKD